MKSYLVKAVVTFIAITCFQWVQAQSEFIKQQQQVFSVVSPKCMAQLADSGYFVLGNYSQDQTFKRLDKLGNILWHKRANLSGTQEPLRAITTSYNKLVSASYTPSTNMFGVLFMDSLGNSISHKQFSIISGVLGDFQVDLTESPDKKVYALGSNHLVKMDSLGHVIWQKRLVASGDINLMNVHPISSSKLILTGFSVNIQAINSGTDIIQVCIDSSGTLLWSKSFGSRTPETPSRSLYANGKIYHIGSIDNNFSGRKGSFIFCTDTTGTQLWCKWTDSKAGYTESVLLKDGTIACLFINVANNTYNILHFSDSGDFISGITLNSPLGFYVRSLIATKDGGVYMEANAPGSNSYGIGIKLAANLYPECIPVLPYTPDSMFNQVFDEMPLLCSVYSYTTSSTVNPSWTNIPFVNAVICSSTCNVVASFKADKTHLCQGETMTFANNSQNATSYQWWLGSTLIGTNPLFSYAFPAAGEYRVKLIASNGICSDSIFTRVLVSAPLPQPVFTCQKDHLKGWFNTVVPAFSSATWNFGDGTGTQMDIDSLVHNYKLQGTYQVCLTETGVCGAVSSCQNTMFSIDSTFQFIKKYTVDPSNTGTRWSQGAHALYGGGLLLSGSDDTWGASGWEGTFVKTDKKGNPIWTQIVASGSISGTNIEVPRIAETHKGYLLLGGSNGTSPYFGIMDSSGTSAYMLRLTNNSQNALAARPYEKPNGNIIFTGCYGNQSFIAETDLALGIFWFKRHTAIRMHYSTVKTSGGFLLAGTDISNTQIGIMKVDDNGDYVYAKSIALSGSTPSSARDITSTPDGNFIVTGSSNNELFLMKIDPVCNVLWTKKYSDSFSNLGFGKSVSVDGTGNISVVSNGGVVLKTDSAGTVIWAWDPPGASVFGAVRHTKTLDDGLIVAGSESGELYFYRFDHSISIPTCWGTPMTITATPITATVSVLPDAQTLGTPLLTKIYSGNLYASNEAEICASGSAILDANFTHGNTCSGTSVQFSDLSLGAIISHSWSFQGGIPASSTSINPSVTWSTQGTYVVSLTITRADGSTSTDTQNITITTMPTVNAGSDLTTCAGTTVTLNGSGTGTLHWNASPSISNPSNAVTSVNPSADEVFILNAVLGSCSNSDTVHVSVSPVFLYATNATICSGTSYLFHGQNYSSTGFYPALYTSVNGCDSIYTLNLTVNPPLSSSITEVICDGESYTVGSSVFSATGNYTIPFQNQVGCDSVVTLNLTVIPPTSSVDAEICSGDSYMVGNSTFSSSGTYTINLLNQNGCDSTVTLTLTVFSVDSSITNATICAGESYLFNGMNYSVAGIYSATVLSTNGCDSIAMLNLTVHSASSSILNETICSGENYLFNGNTYSTTGTYSATLQNINGCDSTVELNLTVLNPNIGVSITGFTLTANQSGADYVWLDCDSQLVVGTGQSFTAIENGNYAVVVTLNNCSDTSICYHITNLGISNMMVTDWLVYPIPSSDMLYIVSPAEAKGEQYVLYDDAGRIVLTGVLSADKTIISLENYSDGVYQLKMANEARVFKVIRQ